MRDHLCSEEKRRKSIEFHKEFFVENKENISSIEEDDRNGIQRAPKDNKSRIEGRYEMSFGYRLDDILARYSLGDDIHTIEEDFLYALDDLEHTETRKVGYLSLLWMVSLGILLETDKQNMLRISKIIERKNMNDFVIDFLLCASDIGYDRITNVFYKEIPYSNTREIIELAQMDQQEASKRLQIYMEKEWFQGHYDYEWKNAHKEPGYVGFWSFETAAIAKILELDDESLRNNNHYPYDLAHYKNAMTFKSFSISDFIQEESEEEPEDVIEGIENNPLLEKIIPPKWHAFVNEFIHDYQEMDDDTFYKTYNLNEIWFFLEDYKEDNQGKNQLGSLLVFALVEKEYILQLDYKDDLEDYKAFIKNYWKNESVKLIQFIVDNDQQYYAFVPTDVSVEQMYEVMIQEVN